MVLGILVNSDRHRAEIMGIARAAVAKGHEVNIFGMDEGTRLFQDPGFLELCKVKGVHMSFCDHSAKRLGFGNENIPQDVVCGSQYNNAMMVHESDKVLVL